MKGMGYFVQMFLQAVKYSLRILSKKVWSPLSLGTAR